MLMNLHLQSSILGTFEQRKQQLGILAVLENLDGVTDLPADPYGNRQIEVGSEDATRLLNGPKLSDRQIRRFLARRIYDAYSRSSLQSECVIDEFDVTICGATPMDLLRNAQLLEEEGYLRIGEIAGSQIAIVPRAKLIREVERYGAAREDAAEESDICSALTAYPELKKHETAILLEYRRYAAARTAVELESVFRAIAPVVEEVVKDVLRSAGSAAQHPALGPGINELRQRSMGNVALWAQLSHILKFARPGSTRPQCSRAGAPHRMRELLPAPTSAGVHSTSENFSLSGQGHG